MFGFLSRNIYEIEPDAFGLDISSETFKFVQMRRRKKDAKLTAFGFGDFPKGCVVDGEIRNEAEVVKILKSAFVKPAQGRLSTNHVVCSLPEEHSFTRVIQLPKMNAKEAQEAVQWEIEQNIPLAIHDVYYDWQMVPTGEKVGHQDVLVSAVPKKLVDGYISVLRACNLAVKGLEVESVSIARAVIKDLATDGAVLVVDLGATATSFIIFSGEALQFTSSVPVAGNKMIEAIGKTLGVDHQEGKKLFYDVGLDKNPDGGKTYGALEPIVKDLADQIKNYISFYEGHAMHEHKATGPVMIKKVLLCGGVANLTGLNVYLGLALKIPVETANPWANILKSPLREVPGLSYRRSLSYTTVLGLALSGIQKES